METTTNPHILAGEKMGDAIFVEFDDGKYGLYPAPLLYAMLPRVPAVSSSDHQENGDEEE